MKRFFSRRHLTRGERFVGWGPFLKVEKTIQDIHGPGRGIARPKSKRSEDYDEEELEGAHHVVGRFFLKKTLDKGVAPL